MAMVCISPYLCLSILLKICYRPLDEHGARLNPADFNQYRKSHQFRGPFCLCSLKFEDQAEDVEAAIYVAKSGICLGEYVLSCARNNCGYFSQSVFLYPNIIG